MVSAHKKALRLALRSLPTRVPLRAASRSVGALVPLPGEQPVVLLRVQVIGCRDLTTRTASVDPYVTLSVLSKRCQTPVAKRTSSPIYLPKDATFDFPLYLSLAERLGTVEMVVWDRKDVLRKEYLGEAALVLEDWFSGVALGWTDEGNTPIMVPLISTRNNAAAVGALEVKIGFVQVPDMTPVDFAEVYDDLVKRSRPSLVSAPPTEGIGTIRSAAHPGHVALANFDFADDGLDSEEDESDEGEGDEGEDDAFHRLYLEEDGSPQPPSPLTPSTTTLGEPFGGFYPPLPVPLTSTSGLKSRAPSIPLPLQPATEFMAGTETAKEIVLNDSPSPSHSLRRSRRGTTVRRSLGGLDEMPVPVITLEDTGEGRRTSETVRQGHVRRRTMDGEAGALSEGERARPYAKRAATMQAPLSDSEAPRSSRPPAKRAETVAAAPSSSRGGKFIPKILRRPTAMARSVSQQAGGKQKAGGIARSASVGKGMDRLEEPEPESEDVPGTSATAGAGGAGRSRRPGLGMRRFTGRAAKEPVAGPAPATVTATAPGRKKARRGRRRAGQGYNLSSAENDIVGIVMLDIHGATDLPRLPNMTRTGWDMDPFVVISFGKKVFRTRVIRHSLNPVWDEKLLFHVRRYETRFNVQLTVLDWDKLTSNDHVGDVSLNVSELMREAPAPDAQTGLYAEEDLEAARAAPGHAFALPLQTEKEAGWEAKHSPTLTFRAKYQPYDALRQQFWRRYLKQYDADDAGMVARLELTSMLDSLGSTLSAATVDSFFARHGKSPQRDALSIAEAVQCLEEELTRPEEERMRVDALEYRPPDTGFVTPALAGGGGGGHALALDEMSFSGPPGNVPEDGVLTSGEASPLVPDAPRAFATEPSEMELGDAILNAIREASADGELFEHEQHGSRSAPATPTHMQWSESSSDAERVTPGMATPARPAPVFERVINVQNCPLCHRPRLSKKAEVDIITHLAICASQDWARVDRIMVGNFVTPSQAQRKWYTKLVGKVSRGAYQLGANSANIIVQNRLTGQLEEEKMQVYVRLGIRLLYKGAKSTMEGVRARRLLKSMTIKQGIKFDSPESARDILPFIAFHGLKINEFLEPVESFRTFNQFFYRRLKPNARPLESPDDPTRLVSAADCRFMAFETVAEATKLWIKGREFTVGRLLGPGYRSLAERYTGGALAIFRLAPQDYHRFHSPVDGVIGAMTYIAGEYYTVNPAAIRTALDVYGENARKIVPIDSPQFGKVMAVCIGATMVGSILTTVNEGDSVKRGQEFGYFAFGGSTIVLLFEKGALEWDEDLLVNGRASLETLVRVGMGIGRSRRAFAVARTPSS